MENDPPLVGFTDRTAFVTGGARGIGIGLVRALLRRGARVAVADINEDALRSAQEDLADAADRVQFYHLDVTDRDRYADIAGRVERDLGPVTLLFNNAGVIDSVSPSKANFTMWDYVMGINLNGVYNGIQTFLPGMVSSPLRCHIVNTASEAGLLEVGSGFLYHASKYAVVGMSESLRRELQHFDIGVSVLLPGPVATDIVTNTRGLRPSAAPAQTPRATAILDSAQVYLNVAGAAPDAVAEHVLDGVVGDEPFIATRDGFAGQFQVRTGAIVAAMRRAQEFMDSAAPSTRLPG